MQKIGIMGGTFDPIHIGHLIMAQVSQVALGLNKVIFIPSARPPHKQDQKVADAKYRMQMVNLSIANNDAFISSDIELKRQGPSYSIDTVRELKNEYPDTDFYFIIGMDSLLDLYKWHCPDELLQECKFIVCKRPGYNLKTVAPELKTLLEKYKNSIYFLDSLNIEISSSNIRARIQEGLPYRYMVRQEVYDYMIRNNLYDASVCELLMDLKTHLSSERYIHSLSVADVAVRLAERYHVDPEQARIAALLHDNAKFTKDPETLLELCLPQDRRSYMLSVTDAPILHAFAGVGRALNLYPNLLENDKDIRNAVRFHTTGRLDMTPLEQIIYIADFIDPKREEFPERSKAYQLAFTEDLDTTCAYILGETIQYLMHKARRVHRLTTDAYEFYKNKTSKKK